MSISKSKKIATFSLYSALVCIATFIHVPIPGYRIYFNLGEGAIYTIAILFGGAAGGIAGGLGSALADLILGYPLWAPFTLVIKGIEGFVVGKVGKKNKVLALSIGATVMITGYSLAAGFLYGIGAIPVEALTDLVQCSVGILVALPLVRILHKSSLEEKLQINNK
ncbi:MAG: ECF transporter S component [Synergistetes bacterium]|nr:ECF transporter S component [Synergistota bacterium]MCX8127827.1 ECF transporter S component [Synergistota bacterium]MDW8192089.1 ECF transporter S component [Synergistota bacterium]